MKFWIKGAIIGVIFFSVLISLNSISPEYEYGNPFALIILILAFPIKNIITPSNNYIWIITILTLYGFLLGAVISYVINKIKRTPS